MNKYEELFNEIKSKTRDETLKWQQLRRSANSDIIFNPSTVFRQFSASLERGGAEFKILLVEKKFEDPDSDFGYEKYYPELLLISEGELVATIDDSVIAISDMANLASTVESKMLDSTSSNAQKLFA